MKLGGTCPLPTDMTPPDPYPVLEGACLLENLAFEEELQPRLLIKGAASVHL